jgi:hypothetical protein
LWHFFAAFAAKSLLRQQLLTAKIAKNIRKFAKKGLPAFVVKTAHYPLLSELCDEDLDFCHLTIDEQ